MDFHATHGSKVWTLFFAIQNDKVKADFAEEESGKLVVNQKYVSSSLFFFN